MVEIKAESRVSQLDTTAHQVSALTQVVQHLWALISRLQNEGNTVNWKHCRGPSEPVSAETVGTPSAVESKFLAAVIFEDHMPKETYGEPK